MNAKMRAHPDAVGGTTAKTCLRCDWEGETKGSDCPDCGVPLYVVGASARSPATTEPTERTAEAEERSDQAAPLNGSLPDPTYRMDSPAASASITRSAGAFIVAALVLIVALDAWFTSERGVATMPESPDTTLDDVFAASISQLDLTAPPAGVGPIEDLPGWNSCSSKCRRELTVGGVQLSFRCPRLPRGQHIIRA